MVCGWNRVCLSANAGGKASKGAVTSSTHRYFSRREQSGFLGNARTIGPVVADHDLDRVDRIKMCSLGLVDSVVSQ